MLLKKCLKKPVSESSLLIIVIVSFIFVLLDEAYGMYISHISF